MKTLEALNPSDVLKVYSGKDGKCCCGCAGKYSYNSNWVTVGGRCRGYPVDPSEANDRMVSTVLHLMQNLEPHEVEVGSNYYSTVVGKRLYILYPLLSAEML